MKKTNKIAIFEDFKIRRHYDEKTEKWYFSVIDIVAVLISQGLIPHSSAVIWINFVYTSAACCEVVN